MMDSNFHILASKVKVYIPVTSSSSRSSSFWSWPVSAWGTIGDLGSICKWDKQTLQNAALSTLFKHSLLTLAGIKVIRSAALLYFTSGTFIPLLLFDLLWDVLLVDPIILDAPQRRLYWRELDLCWWVRCLWVGSPGRAAACSLVSNVVWYANFCTGAVFWLIQYDPILVPVDCHSLSTKIRLRTYFS